MFVIDRWRGAAAVALPGCPAFLEGEDGDGERDGGIDPPEPEGRVEREACEDADRKVGAEQVLGAFARGRTGAEALADAVFGFAEERHDDDARDRQADSEPAGAGVLAGDQDADRVLGDVRGE